MLFDLRSRGRRRTVQVVYLGLAILIGGGLVLFGVGTGSSGGGLLNGLTGNGSNQQSAQISAQEKTALAQTRKNPGSPGAWADLISARWENASSVGYDQTTGTYTASGRTELQGVTSAWQHYVGLTKTPDTTVATLAARAYGQLGDYSGEAGAWEAETTAAPSEAKGYECLALSAYAAKQTRVGDLALAKLEGLVPKAQAKAIATQVETAKTQPTLAQSC
jgi:hypothetical protein